MNLFALVLIGCLTFTTAQQQNYDDLLRKVYESQNVAQFQPALMKLLTVPSLQQRPTLPLTLQLPSVEAPKQSFSNLQSGQQLNPQLQHSQYISQNQANTLKIQQPRPQPLEIQRTSTNVLQSLPIRTELQLLQFQTQQPQPDIRQLQAQQYQYKTQNSGIKNFKPNQFQSKQFQSQKIKSLPQKDKELPSNNPQNQLKNKDPQHHKLKTQKLTLQTLSTPQTQTQPTNILLQQNLQPPVVPFDPNVNFNGEYPVPSQDLTVPSIEWNPNNDPKLFYKLPAALTKQETPTNAFPKKFNQEIHEKSKPVSTKPKQQYDVLPVTPKDFTKQQKEDHKTRQNFEKKQNQKAVQTEKRQQTL